MYFHGAPGSRLDLAQFEDALAALELRVISADRPGFGRSTPQSGRRREDWFTDVAALADQIGVQRFALLGSPVAVPMPRSVRPAFQIASLPPRSSRERPTSRGLAPGTAMPSTRER
jgi:hypothetical protein